mmetsp:Transcript_18771/g.43683  ORF Transcript_18771/g.43683 Transcript_18771/m.43683 type:complete len:205 (+) Transcript_18771:361-975(+)
MHAMCSGVRPLLSVALTSAPRRSSSSTTLSRFAAAAWCSAVAPSLSQNLMDTPLRSISSRHHSTLPARIAQRQSAWRCARLALAYARPRLPRKNVCSEIAALLRSVWFLACSAIARFRCSFFLRAARNDRCSITAVLYRVIHGTDDVTLSRRITPLAPRMAPLARLGFLLTSRNTSVFEATHLPLLSLNACVSSDGFPCCCRNS